MNCKCVIDNHRGVKNGLKITFHIDNEEQMNVLKNLPNFMQKPLIIDIRVDEKEAKEILNRISPEQRKKIYALFKDIADYTGDNAEAVKINTKHLFLQSYGHEQFSLSDCSSEVAKDYITFLVSWCFVNGVDLKEKPKEILDDIETYMYLCIKYKKCCVCGKEAIVHLATGNKQIPLCEEHKPEWESKGREFYLKYHVKPIEA